MAVKFNKLLLCLLIAIHVVAPESTEVIHVVAPVYKEYAAVGVMINSFLSQTNDNWTLTFVSDGIDERMEALVKLYSSIPLLGDNIHDNSPDVRIKYMNTPYRTNDGGHSPRALGLSSLTNTGWTVLSGGDNYYCPLFIASLLDVITVPNNIGFIYWDFVLDRKGNQLPPSITDESKNTDKYLVSIPIVIGDISHDLSFNEHDDLHLLAHTFATQHGLMEGGGCEAGSEASGTSCVTHRLIVAMQGELERALTGQQPSWKELPDRYEGYVSASLVQGGIDVGAFAFPTHIGQHVGYRWRHHSADWSFASDVLEQIEGLGLETHHIKRTLYVHN